MAFHLKRDGKIFGPFEAAKLKELASTGRLIGTDMISSDGGKKWGYVSQAKGLGFVSQEVEEPQTKLPPVPQASEGPKPSSKLQSAPTMALPPVPSTPPTDQDQSVLPSSPNHTSTSRTFSPLSIAVVVWMVSQVAFVITLLMQPQSGENSPGLAALTWSTGIAVLLCYIGVMILGAIAIEQSSGSMSVIWILLFIIGMCVPVGNVIVVLITLSWIQENLEAKERQQRGWQQQASRHQIAESRLPVLFQMLASAPDNATATAEIMQHLRACPSLASNSYQAALNIVQQTNGAPAAKILALELGRLFFASNRPDGNPTIYDEQAINNDIKMRCMG